MKLKPLTGQVLIEVVAPATRSPGGVELPDERPLSPEFVEQSHTNPTKPAKNHVGIVREVGPWPKNKSGMLIMPEFSKGAKVVFNPYHGTELRYHNVPMRMVALGDVLAVLT